MHSTDQATDTSLSAFREAEKRYQLHFEQVVKLRKGRPKGVGVKVRETDFSDVTDFCNPTTWSDRVLVKRTADCTCFELVGKPGFCFLQKAIEPVTQWRLISDCLERFPEQPATTNHTRQFGALKGLWQAAQQELSSTYNGPQPAESVAKATALKAAESAREDHPYNHPQSRADSQPPSALLSKLRWASVGPNFDWTKRKYLYQQPYLPLPQHVVEIGQRCAFQAEFSLQQIINEPECSQPHLSANGVPQNHSGPCNQSSLGTTPSEDSSHTHSKVGKSQVFQPDAALVNYYGVGDTLGGHCDDVEEDLTKPIVSISLGCDAIFLLGGRTKLQPPDAMLVRSGDVIVLSGESRQCFHGVPRVLNESALDLSSMLQTDNLSLADRVSLKALSHYMSERRINISIRETV